MKNAILAGSIAGTLFLGTNATANEGISSDKLIVQVATAQQYRENFTKQVINIVETVTPEGMVVRQFDDRVSANGLFERVKVGNVTIGMYVPLEQKTAKGVESGTYLGVGYKRQSGGLGSSIPGIMSNTKSGFELQLRKDWKF